MPLGLYISVPFCRTKCTYCNFASDVFSRAMFEKYVVRLCAEIERAPETARQLGGLLDHAVDSIYLGGGTPTLLNVEQLDLTFVTIRQNFALQTNAEISVECAPGTLSEAMIDCLVRNGVNRVSLGVQSFVDQEARSVGRLHNREIVLNDIAHLRDAGISNVNIDLIAGLPHQTLQSWNESLEALLATEVPHASIYMLEVDEESRLGRELIAGGQRYHAHFVPDEDLSADMYELACERLRTAGIEQYEISNFSRAGFESKHNLKYWTRQPYLGFGVDAHSMLYAHVSGDIRARDARMGTTRVGTGALIRPGEQSSPTVDPRDDFEGEQERPGRGFQSCRTQPEPINGTTEGRTVAAVRFANPETLDRYLQCAPPKLTPVFPDAAVEEAFFLGLRLTKGVNLRALTPQFEKDTTPSAIAECVRDGLIEQEGDFVRLTQKGRLLSNEVFEKFISIEPALAT